VKWASIGVAPDFGYDQTEGKPLPPADPEGASWVEALPLIEVAREWGLSVKRR